MCCGRSLFAMWSVVGSEAKLGGHKRDVLGRFYCELEFRVVCRVGIMLTGFQ